MPVKAAVTGNKGQRIRSDCEISLVLRSKGGINLDLTSKVKVLHGKSIILLCREILEFFEIRHADLKIDDSGALPFVISARLEAAIKQVKNVEKEYLPAGGKDKIPASNRERTRYSRLYVPGNTPSMMINAGLHSADGIILDLEDSVPPARKDEARILVRNAMRFIDFRGAERMVRINQGSDGLKDLWYIVPHHVDLVVIPKCENREQLLVVENEIELVRKQERVKNPVFIMPIIESALGVENSFEIAGASRSIAAIAIGLEDLTADLGVSRTAGGEETLYARTRVVNAARAAGIQPVDSVFPDMEDMDALRSNVLKSKAIGFAGMGCIHPLQVPVVNEGFAPGEEEIARSREIVVAFEQAERESRAVTVVRSRMIDAPVVKRARQTIATAIKFGRLNPSWRNETRVS